MTNSSHDNHIYIENPTILLKVLRNFGCIINSLGIDFQKIRNEKLCVEIENYLATYCSNSLQKLSLTSNQSKIVFSDLQKPFKKVIELKIQLGHLQYQGHLQFLNEINFPNVSSIKLDECYFKHPEIIHYENIENFTLHCLTILTYPFSFGNLKHLTLLGLVTVNDALCQCISGIKYLKTLKIIDHDHFNSDSFRKILELENILSNVEEMHFKYDTRMSVDDILRFLKRNQNLRKLSFCKKKNRMEFYYAQFYNAQFVQPLSTNLGDGWKCYIMDPFLNPFYRYFNTYTREEYCFVIERI